MRVLVQRVNKAKVEVDNKIVGKIDSGYLLFVAFTEGDSEENLKKMVRKIINLRIFDDEDGNTNLSIDRKKQSVLSISQFTLYADARKGNRPSFTKSLNSHDAEILYNRFNELLEKEIDLQKGVFGADMKVTLENDGPFTIILDN